jgi:flagellar protein FlbD
LRTLSTPKNCPAGGQSLLIPSNFQAFANFADNSSRGVTKAMIQLTRLNGISIVLNSDLIKTAEASPDTVLTLINGEKIIVRETCDEVTERVLAYRARLLSVVARRLPSYEDLQSAVSIASLDVSGQSIASSPTLRIHESSR